MAENRSQPTHGSGKNPKQELRRVVREIVRDELRREARLMWDEMCEEYGKDYIQSIRAS